MTDVVDGLEPVDGKHTVRVCIGAQAYEISREVVATLGLTLGCAIGPEVRAQLEAAADRRSAAALVLRYLRGRPRTERQVRDKLESHGVGAAAIESVVADLVRQGVVDDARYAVAFVAARQAHRPTGAMRLRRELVARGVPRPLAAAAAGHAATGGELEAALAAARPRVAAARRLGGERGRRRLALFLRRRGFSTADALAACRALLDANVAPETSPQGAAASADAHAPPSAAP